MYGFGIVDGVTGPTSIAELDPNEELHGALDPARQAAWNAALWGSEESNEPGCRGEGEAALGASSARLEAIADLLNARGDALEADPRYDAMWKRWSRCMRRYGIDAPNLGALQDEIAEDAGALARPDELPPRPFDADPAPMEVDPPTDHAIRSAVDEIRRREIEAAEASVHCLSRVRRTFQALLAYHRY